jgi:sensor domain CHASE-containing protein/cell division protein FtsB
MYGISSAILFESYLNIEDEQIRRNLTRVEGALENYSDGLTIKLRDWASWDESYQFIQDKNTQYIEANLADATLTNLEINLMAYVDNNGVVAYAKNLDLTSATELPSAEIVSAILAYPGFQNNDHTRGVIRFQNRLLIIEALPILPTSLDKPKEGTLIFARFIDEEFITSLEELTQLSLAVVPTDQANDSDQMRIAKNALNRSGNNIFIQALSDSEIAGYFKLNDISGNPTAIVEVVMPREIYAQGKNTVSIFFIVSSASILVFGVIVLFLLEYLLLQRFAKLSAQVENISVDNLKRAEVHAEGNDELGKLAQKINHLLDEIGKYQKESKEAARLEAVAKEKLRKSLEATESMNKLMIGRELKMVELKEKLTRLEGKQPDETAD